MWAVKGIEGKVFIIKGIFEQNHERKDAIKTILQIFLGKGVTLEEPEPGIYELIAISFYSYGQQRGRICLQSEGTIFVGKYIPSKDDSIEEGIHFEDLSQEQIEKFRGFLNFKQV